LYRVFRDYFAHSRIPVLLGIFFIPSFLYWTSGLHKEGLLFNSIALTIYVCYFGLKQGSFGWRRVAVVLLSLLVLLVLRNYIVMLLLPALLAWLAAQRLPWKPVLTFSFIYLLFAAFFFAAPYISPSLDFPAAIVEKQRQFLQLSGNSAVPVQKLEPSFPGFLRNAPQALNHALIRPYFTDIRHLLSMAAAVEINGLLLLVFIYLIPNYKKLRFTPYTLFCLFFSLSILLIIGYTVPFLGAIVRYRSIVLPLLFVPVLVGVPWSQFGRTLFNISFKNNV
jgi:hypothetical protein